MRNQKWVAGNVNNLKDIDPQIGDCTLISDRGYLSAEIQLRLFESGDKRLNTPMGSN